MVLLLPWGMPHLTLGHVGKNRRITFLEVANEINAMIDVAKVADLVLLMIDASFGFEMVRRWGLQTWLGMDGWMEYYFEWMDEWDVTVNRWEWMENYCEQNDG